MCCLHIKPFFLLLLVTNDISSTSAVHPVSVLILYPRKIRIVWLQTVRKRKTKTTAINQGKSKWNACVPGTRTQQNKPDQKNKKTKNLRGKKADRSSEECDARRSERLQEEHTYVLKRNIYLLHGRNYTKTRKEIQGRKKTKKTKKKSVLPGTF